MTCVFASDFDNTLHFAGEREWIPDDLGAIREFRARGGLFGIATGRSLEGLRFHLRDVVPVDFLVVTSGARVLDGRGRPLAERRMDLDATTELYRHYALGGAARGSFHAGDTTYVLREPDLPFQERVDDPSEMGRDVWGLSLRFRTESEASDAVDETNRRYDGVLVSYQNKESVDVVPYGCSKGAALLHLRERLGVDRLGAIGDYYNDLPMLEAADVSYAFRRSPEDMRGRASLVVGTEAEAIRDFSARNGMTLSS